MSPKPHDTDTMNSVLDESLLQVFSERVAAQMGLHFPRERWPELARGIARWAEAAGADPEDCMRAWMHAPPQRAQTEALATHLTVAETYFFRDPACFEALETQVLPPLISARRTAGRRLRVWSAGCASGEETYSLAILLSRLIPDLAAWDIHIVGTDIEPGALAIAQQGIYGDWSFRGLSAAAPQRDFKRLADGRLQVRPDLRRLVSFGYLNLAEGPAPAQLDSMDLVLCRNVLMYFEPACALRVVRRLRAALAAEGWLVVAAVETGRGLYPGFKEVRTSGGSFYRKHADRPKPAAQPATSLPQPIAAMPERHSDAERKRLEKILAHCSVALAADRCNAELHQLQALVHEELGQFDEARAALRRVLFLDPGRSTAHLALGRLCRRLGRPEQASRHFANALALLRRGSPAPNLPAAQKPASIAAELLARLQDVE